MKVGSRAEVVELVETALPIAALEVPLGLAEVVVDVESELADETARAWSVSLRHRVDKRASYSPTCRGMRTIAETTEFSSSMPNATTYVLVILDPNIAVAQRGTKR